ncbi:MULTISPECIES: efflux transporter outer membrane subunit [Burkholderia]|uniref:Outer membrane efflux lipoprotein n=1 Tax=Burkholderia paludis TaxID=1506587 RepID=A0A6J5E599_9BURK|nr:MULTISPECIES: efflux transporter outer membrane subunit [Burkholderia]CAB3760242.1 Outer membrane protein OprM [Burkholderia paludis]VWC05085.1 outer membrane efflux lipoprotein [Burkholderia paludis]
MTFPRFSPRPAPPFVRRLRTCALGAAIALAVAGCAVGPDYRRPAVATPATWRELPGWTQAKPDADGPKGDWWTAFNDPLLNELEPLVTVSNQTVRQDYYNYQQALALVREARSGLFPTVSATTSATRQRTTGAGSPTVANAGALEGTVSWSPDLWGEVRRTVEERKASAQASAATYANAALSEQVTLATTVIDLRVADANLDLLDATVKADEAYLRVIADQDKAGTIPPSDLVAAQTQLESAQSSLIALGVTRAKYVHAIAVLVGRTPEALDVPHHPALPALPDVPVAVPSTLLQRRPDIAVAERQMASANAAIGVAIAAYYPTISLSAAAGFSASPLAGLLSVANYVWSLGASASQTLFDGGERSGEVAAAKAAYDAAVANYRGTVLGALQNVEDDLVSVRVLAEQAAVLERAVADARRGADIAFNEYQAGTVDYTTVATAQTTLLGLQENALTVQQERLVATATLFGDLGGGWSDAQLDAQPSKQAARTPG